MSRVIFSKNARCSEMSKVDGELDFFLIFKNPLSSEPLNLDILTELEKMRRKVAKIGIYIPNAL